jgi:branched-subunit amino acid ABC-type transport system permease component
LSVALFVFADDNKQGWLAVAKTISWTLSAILIWFMLIGPLFTKAIQRLLQKKESRYSDEVLKTLSFLPVLKQLTALAWQQSKIHRGFRRWYFFFAYLIHTTLTYSESASTEISFNDPV